MTHERDLEPTFSRVGIAHDMKECRCYTATVEPCRLGRSPDLAAVRGEGSLVLERKIDTAARHHRVVGPKFHIGSLPRRQLDSTEALSTIRRLPSGTSIGIWENGPVNSIFIDT